MKFILSQKEYAKLQEAAAKAIEPEALQRLCTLVADHVPIKPDYEDEKPEPWGCVHTVKGEHYCDDCPVTDLCPSDKYWSK